MRFASREFAMVRRRNISQYKKTNPGLRKTSGNSLN
jgi:hypothetical protein